MELLEPDAGEVLEAARDKQRAALVAQVVSFSFGVAPTSLAGPLRGSPQSALARRVALYLAHVALQMPMQRVSAAFGRDRTLVGKACARVEDERDDKMFDQRVDALEKCLRLSPAFVGSAG